MKIRSFKKFQDYMFQKHTMCYVEAQMSQYKEILSAICVSVCSGQVIAIYVPGKGVVWER